MASKSPFVQTTYLQDCDFENCKSTEIQDFICSFLCKDPDERCRFLDDGVSILEAVQSSVLPHMDLDEGDKKAIEEYVDEITSS